MAFPTPEALAREFSRELRCWLSADEMATVIARNRAETDPGVCHSHDYCDANMAMLSACETLMPDDNVNVMLDEVITLFNRAWDIARASGFNTGD